jgi:hypothetical protein
MIPFNSDALFVIIDGRQQKGVQTQAKSWVASVEYYHNHLGGRNDSFLWTRYILPLYNLLSKPNI